ncbi:MAG: hypothetical protein CL582_20275 [Alteromonadaceae bacterium]|nr:hypothetical protein [Alteromonadaceae bacterium]
MLLADKLDPTINVAIGIYEDGKLVDRRLSHNVVTNIGREWLSKLVGSDDYATDPPSPHVTSKIGYIGFGCGGALQTSGLFTTGQAELVTVTTLQDPVPIALIGSNLTERVYLKSVDKQTNSSIYFPGDFRTRFIVDIIETELSFAGNKTRDSNVDVGTSVPISEAGLYLSDANPTYTHEESNTGETDPSQENNMVAYNVFSPIAVTPNVVLRVEWELRF